MDRGWSGGLGWCLLMDRTHPALNTLLGEIQSALDHKLYYLAVAVSLSVPDICAAAECEPGNIWVNQKKYEAWCRANWEHRYRHLTAEDCYRLRCGVLHQGNFGRPDDRFERIIFILPNSSFGGHDTKMQGAFTVGDMKITGNILFLEAVRFCQEMIAAARQWYADKAQDANVQANIPNIVRNRPEGFPPLIVGVPVIQ